MSRLVRRLGWFPPFVVGLAAAVAGELAVGLLLYVTPGFLRALTLILAVLLGSLALGLWTSPAAHDETLTESLRRRWLLALVAFAGGSALSGAWSIQGGLAGAAVSRGVGLALLAALPLYACGALLGAMATAGRSRARRSTLGASAAAGAALGTILAGYVLVATLLPVSMYAFCLVLLSGGALLHGSIIAAEGERRTVYVQPSPYGQVEVHEWSWGKTRRERVLVENGRVRGAEDTEGRPLRRWERAALELLAGVARKDAEGEARPAGSALLLLGGGALTLPRHLLARLLDLRVDVVERNRVVVEAAVRHFAAPGEGPHLRLIRADPLPAISSCPGPYAAIVMDAGAAAPHDPLPLLDLSQLNALRARLAPRAFVIVGGIDGRVALGPPTQALIEQARLVFPLVALYGRKASAEEAELSLWPASELMLVLAADPIRELPRSIAELTLESVVRAEPVDIRSLA